MNKRLPKKRPKLSPIPAPLSKAHARLSGATLRAVLNGKHAPAFLHDGGGLYLKITPYGASWIFRYQLVGAPKKMGLGTLRDVSATEARRVANHHRQTVALGRDPKVERANIQREQQEEERRSRGRVVTFRAVADRVLDEIIDKSNFGETTKRAWRSSMRDHVYPKIGNRTLDEIDRAAVLDVLRPIWPIKNVTAKSVRQRIEFIFDEAITRHLTEKPNPARWLDLKRGLSMYPPLNGPTPHPALPWQEVPAFFRRLKAQNGYAPRSLRLAILIAGRTQECLRARFDETAPGEDGRLAGGVWTIGEARMKGRPGERQPHPVPITTSIAEIFEEMETIRRGPYLFPHRSTPFKPMTRSSLTVLLTSLKVRGSFTVHGFRSTFKDWCSDNGLSDKASERQLAHKVTGVKGHYDRTVMLAMRHDLMQRWDDFVTGKITMAKPSAGPRLHVVGGSDA